MYMSSYVRLNLMEIGWTKVHHERKETMILQKTSLNQIHTAPANYSFGGEKRLRVRYPLLTWHTSVMVKFIGGIRIRQIQ